MNVSCQPLGHSIFKSRLVQRSNISRVEPYCSCTLLPELVSECSHGIFEETRFNTLCRGTDCDLRNVNKRPCPLTFRLTGSCGYARNCVRCILPASLETQLVVHILSIPNSGIRRILGTSPSTILDRSRSVIDGRLAGGIVALVDTWKPVTFRGWAY